VDVTNGNRSIVERPDSDAVLYVADENGDLRLKARMPDSTNGYLGGRILYYFREPDSDRWHPISEAEEGAQGQLSGFQPVAVDGAKNVAYGFTTVGGYEAVADVPLQQGAQPQVIMSRDDVDVDELIRIGRQRRVVGASYASEKRSINYFDPELAKFAKSLQAALPGTPLVNIVGASSDESKLLVIASSDTDPGTAYLYDKSTKELNELLPVRNFMDGRQMAQMKPVSFPASDGTMIPGYLTLPVGSTGKGLPAIVLPHGGPSSRDEWGFDWLVQFFAARGYAVLQPNYRGSTGYGDAWFGKNGFQAWETAVGDVNDAGHWLVSQGIAKPDKLAIVGWSYGGYAALQSQVLDPGIYKAVVAIAPVTDLEQLREEARAYTNFKLVDNFIGRGPHVTAGSPARHADRFAAPVMLVHGTMDQNVDVHESRLMADKLHDAGKQVDYVEYDGLDHSLSDSKVRADMLVKVDAFLSAALGKK
jgi:dipeptidyl aminopeptidase/acylaminoacyl peptidase